MDEQELCNVIEELEMALKKYKRKQGTYKGGYWKEKLENKIKSSIEVIESLLKYHKENRILTDSQIPLAKKMIKNAGQLK